MWVRTLTAAAAVVAIPIAVLGEEPAARPRKDPERRVCTVQTEIGSRLKTIRRCRSKAEDMQAKQEAKQVVDRIQALKPTFGN